MIALSGTSATTQSSNPRTSRRPDIPCLLPARRGSLHNAISNVSTTVGRSEALQKLDDDMFSHTTKRPRDSRWSTWCTIAQTWQMQALPLTSDLIRAIGATMKAGGYRSPKLYFSLARQKHRESTGFEPSADVLQMMRWVETSVSRAIGPSSVKASFDLTAIEPYIKQCYFIDGSWPHSAEECSQIAEHHQDIRSPRAGASEAPLLALLGAWWMTREIELAAARITDISIHPSRRLCSWTLPMSKTDIQGTGVTRTHGCVRSVAQDRSATGSSQAGGFRCTEPLCPYHAMQTAIWLREWEATTHSTPSDFLFRSEGLQLTKAQSIQTIRHVAALALGRPEEQLEGVDPSILGHALRVAGAQFMAVCGMDLYFIQLVGRWGSMAIARYVQQAPLARQHLIAGQAVQRLREEQSGDTESTPSTSRRLTKADATEASTEEAEHTVPMSTFTEAVMVLQDKMNQIQLDLNSITVDRVDLVINTKTRYAHTPSMCTEDISSELWQTTCGWYFGGRPHKRTNTSTTHNLVELKYMLCPKCFGDTAPTSSDSDSAEPLAQKRSRQEHSNSTGSKNEQPLG